MQPKWQVLLVSAITLVAMGVGLELWLRDGPNLESALAAYRRSDCAAAIPRLQIAVQESLPDDMDPSLVESRYRLLECQRYQSAYLAQQSRQFNQAFAGYMQFAKVYPHSALIGAVRENVRRLLDQASPGSLVSPEACTGLTILRDRAVVSADHPATPHVILTCGRLFAKRAEFGRAVHAYVALEIHYPDHPLTQLFSGEFKQVLQQGQLQRPFVRNIYQTIEQRELDQLNWMAQPEPEMDWVMVSLRVVDFGNRWLSGHLAVALVVVGAGAIGLWWAWGWWQRGGRRRAPREVPRVQPVRVTQERPAGFSWSGGQYRLTGRQLDRIQAEPKQTISRSSQGTRSASAVNSAAARSTPPPPKKSAQKAAQKPTPPKSSPKAANPQPKAKPPQRQGRPSRAIEQQLLRLVHNNRPTADRLVNLERSRQPGRSE
ncbi:MAG TPA: hypothetical protein V6D46_08565, partial [Coleofasciculaceae cyanobacterium]